LLFLPHTCSVFAAAAAIDDDDIMIMIMMTRNNGTAAGHFLQSLTVTTISSCTLNVPQNSALQVFKSITDLSIVGYVYIFRSMLITFNCLVLALFSVYNYFF